MNKESTPRFGTVNFERRKHPRLSVNLPVEYWQVDNRKSYPAHTADISEGGLLLNISEEIEIGQNLRVKLFFDSGFKLKTIEAKMQAVWKDFRLEKDGYYRVAVKFVDISAQALEELRNFLIILMNSEIRADFNVQPRLLSTLGISIFSDCAHLNPKRSDED
jgi:c-di-GMP-binding flagellar brake protein YcgR